MTHPAHPSTDRLRILTRLAALDLDEALLREAIDIGYQHAATCTSHDPPNLPGILAWAKPIRHLRDTLTPRGWGADDTRNYSTVVHPSGGFAVAVAAGTAATGRPDGRPTTRTPKGPATEEAVNRNQLSLAELSPSSFDSPPTQVELRQTWLLLHHADAGAEEIRLELSLPDVIVGGYVTGWRERLVIEPLAQSITVEIEDDVEEITVDVRRRAG